MKKYDVYLFDFDGTLVDSYESLRIVFGEAYGKVNTVVPEGYTLRLMRVPLYVGYEELKAPQDEESKKLFGSEIIRLLDEPEVLLATRIYDDVKETLKELHNQGKKLGIISSNNRKHIYEVMKFLDIDETLFDVVVGNQESKKHKPNPDPILKGLEALGIGKENVCYVGDGLDDMRCAINAGVDPILVDRRNEYTNEYDVIIKNISELL